MPSLEPEGGTLAFIGGTGPEGRGLALRFARAGHPVIVGSRSRERASEAAAELREIVPEAVVRGDENARAAGAGDFVILTIPFAGIADLLPQIRESTVGKPVISAIAPVEFQEGRVVGIQVEAGSAAQEVARLLPEARVVSAFQTIDAHQLQDLEGGLDMDVVVCSDDVEARRAVVSLANELPGVRALSGGRLATSRYVEGITALLITINRIYKTHSGIRVTGVDR